MVKNIARPLMAFLTGTCPVFTACHNNLTLFYSIGYRSYITIIKELSGKERRSGPLNFFIILIYMIYDQNNG